MHISRRRRLIISLIKVSLALKTGEKGVRMKDIDIYVCVCMQRNIIFIFFSRRNLQRCTLKSF